MTAGTARPLVTFALFAYNQEAYIREAVEGAFAQTYEPLEIILSDDCSSDRTFEIMQEMAAAYDGPHAVRVRRSEVNRGVLSHVLSVARESNGELFVVAAGDDISLPDRVDFIVRHMADSDATAFSSDDIVIDDTGAERDWSIGRPKMRNQWHRQNNAWIHGATAAYKTDFLKYLPLPESPIFFEDMVFADILSGFGARSIRVDDRLIKYRHHSRNLAARVTDGYSESMLEERAIERWARSSEAKLYCQSVFEAAEKSGRNPDSTVLRRVKHENRYLSLLANWKSNTIGQKMLLLYYSTRPGRFRTGYLRAFGERAFKTVKRYKSTRGRE